jgi:hypothetical protein
MCIHIYMYICICITHMNTNIIINICIYTLGNISESGDENEKICIKIMYVCFYISIQTHIPISVNKFAYI